jgi:NhaP-type Na+/H+ or K+/H+ antiporter
MEGTALLVVALVVLGYGLISRRIHSTIVSAPMIFVGAGWIIGAGALGIVDVHEGASAIHVFAEITLILVLFTDAAHVDLRALRKDVAIPLRMLVLGMPLTIVFGALFALGCFPGLNGFEAALLAAILAPTDAALGQAVVSDPAVPGRVRRTLNVESGLNDGIALPVVLALAACAEAMGQDSLTPWLGFTAKQLILGPVVGIAVGYLGGQLVDRASRAGWMNESFHLLSGLALAFLSYGAAEWAHGNGFIAAFAAGLVLGNTVRGSCGAIYEFAEAEGQLLALITFLLFGAVLLPRAVAHWSPMVFAYAALSLTVVRMLPVSLSLLGAGLRPVTHLFLGWFGPRGLASILFGLLIVERMSIEHRESIVAVVIATVLLSVVAHGISAAPAARAYGKRMARYEALRSGMPEHAGPAEP